jgi:hypothetical protein
MSKTNTSDQTAGAKRRRLAKQSARRESRVKAAAAPRAVARSASLEAVLAPCDPPKQLDAEHSRFVVRLTQRAAGAAHEGAGVVGAVKKTRTSTGRPAATSRQCVYQFRHDRKNRLEDEGGDVTEAKPLVKGARLRARRASERAGAPCPFRHALAYNGRR